MILSPVAMATSATKTNNQSWYSIKAKANDTAEISIYDEIGYWGITAKSFSKDLKALGNNLKQINLHIHSPGCNQPLKMRNKETNRDWAEIFGNKWDGYR